MKSWVSTMKIAQLVAVLLVLFGSVVPSGFGADTLSLSGTGWFIHEDRGGTGIQNELYKQDVRRPGWIPAHVPGNIQADLEAAHLLNPPWYGQGDPRLASVAQKDWWYRKDFIASFPTRHVQLIFDGVDFGFDVWLNGRHLGHRAGQFRRFRFDVSDILRPGKTNMLAVRIDRMPEELADYLAKSDGAMSGELELPYAFLSGEAPFNSGNGFVLMRRLLKDLKSPTNFGWD